MRLLSGFAFHLFFLKILFIVFIYVYVSVPVYGYVYPVFAGAHGGHQIPWNWWLWTAWRGCWELNPILCRSSYRLSRVFSPTFTYDLGFASHNSMGRSVILYKETKAGVGTSRIPEEALHPSISFLLFPGCLCQHHWEQELLLGPRRPPQAHALRPGSPQHGMLSQGWVACKCRTWLGSRSAETDLWTLDLHPGSNLALSASWSNSHES